MVSNRMVLKTQYILRIYETGQNGRIARELPVEPEQLREIPPYRHVSLPVEIRK